MRLLSSDFAAGGARLATAVFTLGLALPGCFFDRSADQFVDHRTYTITGATVRYLGTSPGPSPAPIEASFDYGNHVLDPSAGATVDFESASEGDTSEATVENVRAWFVRYLRQKLDQRAMESPHADGFDAMFGPGSSASDWCLVTAPIISQTTLGTLSGDYTPHGEISGEELPTCDEPPPPECRNPAGATPVLQFSPPSRFSFGDVGVGLDSGFVPIRLTSAGTGRLCLALRDPLGTNADSFDLNGGDPAIPDSCVPHTGNEEELSAMRVLLEPSAHCTLNVRFHPSRPGPHMARLPVESNDSTTPGIDLLGTGMGGILRLTEAAPPSRRSTDTSACVAPPTPDATSYSTVLRVLNAGPGIVMIESPPTDMLWLIDAVSVGGVADPDNTPPWVLAVGSTLEFHVSSGDLATPAGTLSFGGNQQGGPFNLRLNPAATCP